MMIMNDDSTASPAYYLGVFDPLTSDMLFTPSTTIDLPASLLAPRPSCLFFGIRNDETCLWYMVPHHNAYTMRSGFLLHLFLHYLCFLSRGYRVKQTHPILPYELLLVSTSQRDMRCHICVRRRWLKLLEKERKAKGKLRKCVEVCFTSGGVSRVVRTVPWRETELVAFCVVCVRDFLAFVRMDRHSVSHVWQTTLELGTG
ncbi:hypothetical protein M434DRAFT_225449 [Hypoxylon sp. CO27-5]|nr:hypothetical protein M434DRAFT_225449 [Hypoxylon sp. CO27-5]